jgi:ankyrin repeat protein
VTRDFYQAFVAHNLELADMLLKQGADINCANCGDMPVMSRAVFLQPTWSEDLISWVLARGGNPNIDMFPENQDGVTAFMRFSKDLFNQMMHYNAGVIPLTVRFLEAGTDVKATSQAKQTALHFLGENATVFIPNGPSEKRALYIKYMDMLIDAGADINARDLEGRTPVMNAASKLCSVDMLKAYQQRRADLTISAVDGSSVRDLIYKQAVAGDGRCNPVLAYLDAGAQAVAPVPAVSQGYVQMLSPDKLSGSWRGVLKVTSPSVVTVAVEGEIKAGGEVILHTATGIDSYGRVDAVQADRFVMALRSRAPQGQKFPNGSSETAEFKVDGSAKDGVLRGLYQATYDAGEFILCKEGMAAIPECVAPGAGGKDLARAVGGLLNVFKTLTTKQ